MRTPRSGFTLLEALIALVIINVGLLALVASTTVLIRQTAEVRARSAAVRAAANRLQQLGVTTCAPTSGSAAGAFGIRETWSIDVQPGAIRELLDSVMYATPSGPRSVVLRTKLPC
jgi:type II secretion system protein I